MASGNWFDASGGSLETTASLVNVGANPCRIDKPLSVELDDAGGQPILKSGAAVNPLPAAENVAGLPAGGAVGTLVDWQSWCGSPLPIPARLRLTLAQTDAGQPGSFVLTSPIHGPVGTEPACFAGTPNGTGIALAPFVPPQPGSNGGTPQACRVGDLAAFSGGWGGAAGTSYAPLVVLNAGAGDCLFPATPEIELFDADGHHLLSSGPAGGGDGGSLTIPAGATASTDLGFSDWCLSTPRLPLTIELLVGTAVLAVAQPADPLARIGVPPCMAAPATPAAVLFLNEAFSVRSASAVPPADPGDALPMRVAIGGLHTVAPGSVLIYRVTLTNTTLFEKPLNLSASCPTYRQTLTFSDGSSATSRFLLNCGPAGVVAPGAGVVFEMQLTIPSSAPTGPATLFWELGVAGAADKAGVVIGP
ncbi:MAG TPA: DUF4232 domain-containing protein [Candidatus Acidoferrales bacterium]|nr:DUF4232 domain-containing protein [Candidatus Acidoferrales bacterium]